MIIFEMVFCVVLGSLFHFTYDWSRKNPLVGWLTAVNESTWEHMKLAILPMILTIPIDRAFYDGNSNYWLAKFLMIFVAMILIPALFYLEKILLKKNKLAIDISIFVLAVIYGVVVFGQILNLVPQNIEWVGIVGLAMIFIAFAAWTYFPPKWFLFIDPRNNKTGLDAYDCGCSCHGPHRQCKDSSADKSK